MLNGMPRRPQVPGQDGPQVHDSHDSSTCNNSFKFMQFIFVDFCVSEKASSTSCTQSLLCEELRKVASFFGMDAASQCLKQMHSTFWNAMALHKKIAASLRMGPL